MNHWRRLYIALWISGYALIFALGIFHGLQPLIILSVLLILAIPPIVMHLLACSRVMTRTRDQYPAEWKQVGGTFQIREYLFDGRDFGDATIARAKRDLRIWLIVGIISIALFLPTLYAIGQLTMKNADKTLHPTAGNAPV